MLEKAVPVIKCCVCGQEYIPSEIFIPEHFFGNQSEILKTDDGHIDYYMGSDMDLDEEYICDNCGTKLKIHANLIFDVTAEKDVSDEEYVTTFEKPEKIKLTEENLF